MQPTRRRAGPTRRRLPRRAGRRLASASEAAKMAATGAARARIAVLSPRAPAITPTRAGRNAPRSIIVEEK
ncbi:MAG: hypothetical protein RXP91_06190 [Nitrososphaeria archaeon]